MRQKSKFDRDALHFAPFVLFPSPFPRDEFNKALRLQLTINELMHKVGRTNKKQKSNKELLNICCRLLMTTTF